MTAEEFDRFLRRRLCWIDGTPTHGSSAKQRQCPHCRRKWSYDRLLQRWDVALALVAGKPRGACAAELEIDIHTAGRLYARMEARLVEHLATKLAGSMAGEIGDREEMLQAWKEIVKLRTKGARHRHLVELMLRHLQAGQRVDLIFQLCFRDEMRRKIGQKMQGTNRM